MYHNYELLSILNRKTKAKLKTTKYDILGIRFSLFFVEIAKNIY